MAVTPATLPTWWIPFFLWIMALLMFSSCGGAQALALNSSSSSSANHPHHRQRSSASQQLHPQDVHVIILVHGWMGNPQEMGYLASSLERRAEELQRSYQQQKQKQQTQADGEAPSPPSFPKMIIHSVTSNLGQTNDGIAAGGARLAQEVNELLESLLQENDHPISLSWVGNSLGGLYARYALPHIVLGHDQADDKQTCDPTTESSRTCSSSSSSSSGRLIRPAVFCTTATPHLGVNQHTYLPLPRFAECLVAGVLQRTGQDLFQCRPSSSNDNGEDSASSSSSVIQDMTTLPHFVQPLQRYEARVAHANAIGDFQVPTATAAFVNQHGQSKHYVVDDYDDDDKNDSAWQQYGRLAVETMTQETQQGDSKGESGDYNATHLAERLDALGWTKFFWDVRSLLPTFPLFGSNNDNHNKTKLRQNRRSFYTSAELYQQFPTFDNGRVPLPFGHTMLIANSKYDWYAELNAGGRPIMDWVARDLLQRILFVNKNHAEDDDQKES